jgi:glucose dehydrogenase
VQLCKNHPPKEQAATLADLTCGPVSFFGGFHTIPQPGEPNSETWTDEARKDRSGTNAWGIITLDTQTGTVFLPIGSSTYDYYGGDRPGNDFYASSVIALDALG